MNRHRRPRPQPLRTVTWTITWADGREVRWQVVKEAPTDPETPAETPERGSPPPADPAAPETEE